VVGPVGAGNVVVVFGTPTGTYTVLVPQPTRSSAATKEETPATYLPFTVVAPVWGWFLVNEGTPEGTVALRQRGTAAAADETSNSPFREVKW
jgi:hypothetical protein